MLLKEPLYCRIVKTRLNKTANFPVMLTGDWHVSPIVSSRQYQMLNRAIEKIRPKLILLQGDLVDSPEELTRESSLKKLKGTLKLCASSAPTAMILGSHDFLIPDNSLKLKDQPPFSPILDTWGKICQETGVKLLIDDWFEVGKVRVFGLFQDRDFVYRPTGKHYNDPAWMEQKVRELHLEAIQKSPGTVHWLLTHAPEMTVKTTRMLKNFDIMSFGHTHGGCTPLGAAQALDAFHLHGGLISPELKLFQKDLRGVTKLPTGTLKIINSGMVATQFCAPVPTQYANFLKAAEVTEVLV